MILLNQFTTLREYMRAVEADAIPRPKRCTDCGHGTVWFIGWFSRHVNLFMAEGRRDRQEIPVRRCRCAKCRTSFGLLPAFAYPHRQFGMETIEWVVMKLLRRASTRPWDFEGPDRLGPSQHTVRRLLGWVEASFDEALIHSDILALEPGFEVEEIRPVRIAGGRKKQRSLGGRDRAEGVSRILAGIRAWHQAGRRHRRHADRWALRSYLRWLWQDRNGLVLYLTRQPRRTVAFYPMVAT
jgi:hypothetical protein